MFSADTYSYRFQIGVPWNKLFHPLSKTISKIQATCRTKERLRCIENPSNFRTDQIRLGRNFWLGTEQCSCSWNPFQEVYLQIKFLTFCYTRNARLLSGPNECEVEQMMPICVRRGLTRTFYGQCYQCPRDSGIRPDLTWRK